MVTQMVSISSAHKQTRDDYHPGNAFFNVESGTAKDFIVITVDLLNLRNDLFFPKAETAAKLIYDSSFEFSPEYIWSKPVGRYYLSTIGALYRIVDLSEAGQLIGPFQHSGACSILTPCVDGRRWSGRDYFYNPIIDEFISERDDFNGGSNLPEHFICSDGSKFTMDQLVERTYYYVFQVPDIVAEEEGNRMLYLTVDKDSYVFRF